MVKLLNSYLSLHATFVIFAFSFLLSFPFLYLLQSPNLLGKIWFCSPGLDVEHVHFFCRNMLSPHKSRKEMERVRLLAGDDACIL